MEIFKISGKQSPYLFIIKFLLCFLVLYYFFPFYRGITGEGGKMYSPFLDKNLNLVKGFTSFLTGSARNILQAFHYNALQRSYHSLRIDYSRGISVNPSCLGWGVMSFWVAFVYAHPHSWKYKLKWMVIGVVSIIIINITRIALIVLANHLQWKPITSLDHHATFNVLCYCCVFILMFWFARTQKKHERDHLKTKLLGSFS